MLINSIPVSGWLLHKRNQVSHLRQLQINQEGDGCYQKQDQPRKQKLQSAPSLCMGVDITSGKLTGV